MKIQAIVLALSATFILGCSKDDDLNRRNGGDTTNESGTGNGDNDPSTYQVGDIGPAGGYIFFVDSTNQFPDWTYLEAAPEGWSGSEDDPNISFTWRSGVFPNSINTDAMVGTGLENTDILIQSGRTFPGVEAVIDYVVEVDDITYDDWFLPSRFELNHMYLALHLNGLGGFQEESNDQDDRVSYQSSSINNGSSWYVNFYIPDSGERDTDMFGRGAYDNSGYVRPARRF